MKRLSAKPERPEDYRQMLLGEKAELLARLGAPSDAQDRTERVSEEDQPLLVHDEFVSSRLNSLDYERLKKIDSVLHRFESGEYGVCESCGDPISAKRLRAIPWATQCLACQERSSAAESGEFATSAPQWPDQSMSSDAWPDEAPTPCA
jgi:DnaK suppressor protein